MAHGDHLKDNANPKKDENLLSADIVPVMRPALVVRDWLPDYCQHHSQPAGLLYVTTIINDYIIPEISTD